MAPDQLNGKASLPARIALLLNYISKDDFDRLCREIREDPSADISLLLKPYLSRVEMKRLGQEISMFDAQKADMRFGELCIAFGYLTRINLDLALEEQQRLASFGKSMRLGVILVNAGMLTGGQRDLVLQKQAGADLSYPDMTSLYFHRSLAVSGIDMEEYKQISGQGLILLIKNDGMCAYGVKTEAFDPGTTVEQLSALLEREGIIFGRAETKDLLRFISRDHDLLRPFEVARGSLPIDGVDGKLDCFFEQDFLRAGKLSEDGKMDFKERGQIPFVKAGDRLAVIKPALPGRDGVSIFGDVIPAAAAEEVAVSAGKGAVLRGDTVISEVDGNPMLNSRNQISVNDAYVIKGDVDFRTGHIRFDKNILIAGTIKAGFRVEGINVVTARIDGGLVKATGDVIVRGGVTESRIEAQGDIRAAFVHRSFLLSREEIHIQKEMVDSEAVAEGRFEMPMGRLFSSRVSARRGARIFRVGSERDIPSTVAVGRSDFMDAAEKEMAQKIRRQSRLLEENMGKRRLIQDQLGEIQSRLDRFSASMAYARNMLETSAESQKLIEKSLEASEKRIQALNREESFARASLMETEMAVESCTRAVSDSLREKQSLKQARKRPRPVLDISGGITAKTKICGPNATVTLSRDTGRTRFMERHTGKPGKNAWEIAAIPI